MARENTIIRTADICDDHREDARICEIQFKDVGGRNHFHGTVVCLSTYEDNTGLRAVLAEGGAGKVLVVDGRGSLRRALCGWGRRRGRILLPSIVPALGAELFPL